MYLYSEEIRKKVDSFFKPENDKCIYVTISTPSIRDGLKKPAFFKNYIPHHHLW